MGPEEVAPEPRGVSVELLRDGTATEYGPGVGWKEDRHTTHWLENRGTVPVVEISVDIVSKLEA